MLGSTSPSLYLSQLYNCFPLLGMLEKLLSIFHCLHFWLFLFPLFRQALAEQQIILTSDGIVPIQCGTACRDIPDTELYEIFRKRSMTGTISRQYTIIKQSLRTDFCHQIVRMIPCCS